MKTDIEVISEAIELIEKDDGFCKGTYCMPAKKPVSFCLEGAIRHAAEFLMGRGDDFAKTYQVERLEGLAYRLIDPECARSAYERLCNYNDDQDTTQEDAVLLLKHTKAYLEQQAAQESGAG